MSREPRWLTRRQVEAIHGQEVLRRGGFDGVRDDDAIESALARPRQKWTYEQAELPALAAAYGFGLAKNHGYVDGNERTAFTALVVFLGLNGYDLVRPEPEVVTVMEGVASSELSEAELAAWIGESVTPRPPKKPASE